MKVQYKILLSILILAISFTTGYFASPTKVVERVKVEYKTVKEEAKTRVVYRDKITKPDGTIIEKEVEREDTLVKEKVDYKGESEKVATKDLGLVLGVTTTVPLSDIKGSRQYSVIASKRLIGALNGIVGVGVGSNNQLTGTVGLGWSF